MGISDYISAGLLTASAILLLVAGALALLRRTRGLPPFQRARAMIALVGALIYSQLPSRRSVAVVTASLGGFIAGGLTSVAVRGALIRWYSASLPRYEEAYEGFGDAVQVMIYALCGLMLSAVVGVGRGLAAAYRVSVCYDRREAAKQIQDCPVE